MSNPLDHYKAEANSIRRAVLLAAERHYAQETGWYRMVYLFGIPSTILSAIAEIQLQGQIFIIPLRKTMNLFITKLDS